MTKKLALTSLVAGVLSYSLVLLLMVVLRHHISNTGVYTMGFIFGIIGYLVAYEITDVGHLKLGVLPHFAITIGAALAIATVPLEGSHGVGLVFQRWGQFTMVPYNVGTFVGWFASLALEAYTRNRITMPSRF